MGGFPTRFGASFPVRLHSWLFQARRVLLVDRLWTLQSTHLLTRLVSLRVEASRLNDEVPQVKMELPLGLETAPSMLTRFAFWSFSPVLAFHRTSRWFPALARVTPPGRKDRVRTCPPCSESVWVALPVAGSQIFTLASSLPLARVFP